jgi:hypothetical protein
MASPEDLRKFGQFAHGFGTDSNIDRHKCHRTTPLEVLHLAHSRTGTLSKFCIVVGQVPNLMCIKLITPQACGWKLSEPSSMALEPLRERAMGSVPGLCGTVTDQPAIIFAAELLEAYPDGKVVIVERDIEPWYRSIKALFAASLDLVFLVFRFTDPYWIGRII